MAKAMIKLSKFKENERKSNFSVQSLKRSKKTEIINYYAEIIFIIMAFSLFVLDSFVCLITMNEEWDNQCTIPKRPSCSSSPFFSHFLFLFSPFLLFNGRR